MFLTLSFLPTLLLIPEISGHKISKCCPLGEILFSGVCVDMRRRKDLPKIRVGSNLLTFHHLKEQNLLEEGHDPSCKESGEVFPDFLETATLDANQPYFSPDGVFIHELNYYRPEDYCVDGELDSYEYQEEMMGEKDAGEDGVSYIKVQMCEELAGRMGGCLVDKKNCYSR